MNRKEMRARLDAGEDPRTLSLVKWEDIEAGKGKDFQSSNCALCQIYYPPTCQKLSGEKCPIFLYTGKSGCQGTPYVQYVTATNSKQRRFASHNMVEFLKRCFAVDKSWVNFRGSDVVNTKALLECGRMKI